MEKFELKLTALKFVKDNNYKEEGKTDLQLADEIYVWLNSEEKPKEELDYRNHQSLKGILTHEDKAPEPENFIMEPELVKEMLDETKPFEASPIHKAYVSKNGIKIDIFDSEKDISVMDMIKDLDDSWDGNITIERLMVIRG